MKEIILELINSPEIVKLLVSLFITGLIIGGFTYWNNKKEFIQFVIGLIIFLVIVEIGRDNYYSSNYNSNTITPIVFVSMNTIIFIAAMFLGINVSKYARHKECKNIDLENVLLKGNEIVTQYLKNNNEFSLDDDVILKMLK